MRSERPGYGTTLSWVDMVVVDCKYRKIFKSKRNQKNTSGRVLWEC